MFGQETHTHTQLHYTLIRIKITELSCSCENRCGSTFVLSTSALTHTLRPRSVDRSALIVAVCSESLLCVWERILH